MTKEELEMIRERSNKTTTLLSHIDAIEYQLGNIEKALASNGVSDTIYLMIPLNRGEKIKIKGGNLTDGADIGAIRTEDVIEQVKRLLRSEHEEAAQKLAAI